MNLVSFILSFDGAISDDPSPDGTTAFSMALSKGDNNCGIVEMIFKSKIEPKKDMEALLKASKESGPDPSQPIDKE